MPEHYENESPSAAAAQGGTPPAGKEKDVHDLMVANVSDFLHQDKVVDGMIGALKSGNPGPAIGRMAAEIVDKVASTASQQGHKVTAEMAMSVAAFTIGEIIEIGTETGALGEVAQEDQLKQQALQGFMQAVGEGAPTELAHGEAEMVEEPVSAPAPAGAIARAGGV